MIIIKHTQKADATVQQIWHVLQDVEHWNSWDHDLESSNIDGPFQAGTVGHLKFKDGPMLTTKLTQVEPFKMFVQEAKLFLAKVIMTHVISQENAQIYVTFQSEIQGPLAFFYAWLLGSSIKKKIPIEMAQMLEKANRQSM